MSRYPHGSEWRKWDLHLHTPSSYDYHNMSVTDETIIDALSKKGISGAVITDHHRIDVKRISNLRSIAAGKDICILPGIEFRSELGGSESVHFIGIFPEECKLEDVWIEIQAHCSLKESDWVQKGADNLFADLADTYKLVHSLGGLVTIHAGRKSNSIEEIKNTLSYKMAQKTEIAKHTDFFELGRAADAAGYETIVFPSIGKVVPMVLSSDNHDVAKYAIEDFSWIKCDPTFEGLKQAVFEPTSRVRICNDKPEEKHAYQVIRRVRFRDNRPGGKEFQEDWICLNPNLNSIIGGKSSGKSLLLYHIAKTIDPDRIADINHDSFYSQIGYSYDRQDGFDFEVEWADGQTYGLKSPDRPNRPITYLPQLYLNRLAEDKKSELNELVEQMLTESNPDYKSVRASIRDEIVSITNQLNEKIGEFFRTISEIESKKKELKAVGDKTAIETLVASLDTSIKKIRDDSAFSEKEESKYRDLQEILRRQYWKGPN